MHGFEYLHLSLHNHETQHTELLNRVFEIWEKTFTGIAKTNEVALDPDEFFRSHHVGVLMFHDEIVGFNLFTMFDLSLLSTTRHRYFRGLGDCSPGRLNSKQVNRVLTMEYFTITPKWRKQMKETPWGEILTGLGLKFMDSSSADAVLGTPRIDLKVHEMCYRLGGYDFQEPVDRMNYKCAVVLFPKEEQRTFVNPLTKHWVRNLSSKLVNEAISPAPLNVLAVQLEESA
jgi:hypothetical protein